jgi:hypothetical protein
MKRLHGSYLIAMIWLKHTSAHNTKYLTLQKNMSRNRTLGLTTCMHVSFRRNIVRQHTLLFYKRNLSFQRHNHLSDQDARYNQRHDFFFWEHSRTQTVTNTHVHSPYKRTHILLLWAPPKDRASISWGWRSHHWSHVVDGHVTYQLKA